MLAHRLAAVGVVVGCARAAVPSPPPAAPAPPPRVEASTTAPSAPVESAGTTPSEAPTAALPPESPKIPETGHAFQTPLPPRELDAASPARRFANLTAADCAAELRHRNLPVARDGGPAEGIAVPVRLTGELRGVRFLSPGQKSVYGKLDCRLALALDELAEVLFRHDIVTVRVDNLYRPRAHLPGRHTSSQHRYGLAIDVVAIERADGTELSVERDFHAAAEGPPCGPDARVADATEQSVALRDIVCEIARSGIFHHLLTPSYNEAHHDHLHLDIKRGEKRWLVE